MTTTNPVMEALEMLLDEKIDYMNINNLGKPEEQHVVKFARTALPIAIAQQKFIEAYDEWYPLGSMKHLDAARKMIHARQELQQLMKQKR